MSDYTITINGNDLTLINEAMHELTKQRGLAVVMPVAELCKKIQGQISQPNEVKNA